MNDIHINLTCNLNGIKDGAAKCSCKCECIVPNPKTSGNLGKVMTAAMCQALLNCMHDNFDEIFDVAMNLYMKEKMHCMTLQEYEDTDF